MKLKKDIFSLLNEQLSVKITSSIKSISSAIDARDNEVKSSAGDKYETGREVMQFEIDKQTSHLNTLKLLQQDLLKIDLHKRSTKVDFGSLVITDKGNYFLSVSLGSVVLNSKKYYAISLLSPLGKVLLGKSVGDFFIFNKQRFLIKSLH